MPILKVKDNGEWKEIGEGSLVDSTLTVAGASADAKAAGDRINELGAAIGTTNSVVENLTYEDIGAAPAEHTHNYQAPLGFTPIQQGGGEGQFENKINIGWNGGDLQAHIDYAANIGVLYSAGGAAKIPLSKISDLTPTNIGALPITGGTITGTLTVSNNNSAGGGVAISEDGEGGTIRITSPNGTYCYEIDAHNDKSIRMHTATKHPADVNTNFLYWNGDIGSLQTNYLMPYNPVDIAYGGTGATDAASARTNLGITPANIGAISTSASCNRNWQWAAQSGTPAYVWGTNANNGTDCYVWYTGNFDVNSAAKIRSRGSVTAESGTNYPEVSGLSMSQVYTNGYPTNYGNVMTMYGGGCSQLLIGWSGASGANAPVYVRSKRDTADASWSSWAQVYDSVHKPTCADIGAMPATGGLFDNWAYRIEKSIVGGRNVSARDRAIIRSTTGSDTSFCCTVSTKTTNGTWDMGTYGESFILQYATDANFNAGTNTITQGLRITETGALVVGAGSFGSTLPSGGVKGQIFFKI